MRTQADRHTRKRSTGVLAPGAPESSGGYKPEAPAKHAAAPSLAPQACIHRYIQPHSALSFSLGAGVVLAVSILSTPARADLHFPEPVVNAGVVYAGAPLTHEFTFVNQGPETVAITEARASCGCLKPRVAQNTYRPGEKGSILLEVHTLSQTPGPHTWAVTLTYQLGSVSREMTLQLNARLIAEVTVQPAALVIVADKLAQHELVLTDTRAESLQVREVHTSSAKLFARVSEPIRDAKGHTARNIRLAVADDYPDGRHEETLDVYTTDPRYTDIRVPVTILKHAEQRLVAAPSQVELIAAAGQALPSRIILLRDERGQNVHIHHVLADDPAITCHWAQGPNAMATLKIRVERTLSPGESFRSAIHVQVDEPVSETLTIPVIWSVR